MGFLIKSTDELLEKGQDLIKQREFAKAQSALSKAADKARENGDSEVFAVSNALAFIMRISENGSNPSTFYDAGVALKQLGERDLKIGIKSVNAMALSTECFLISEELAAQAIPTSIRSLQERAKRLNDVGTKFQTNIGNNTLFLPELFSNYSDTGIRRALRLFAESQENLAEATVYFDPKKAAEYYQNAANYRQQIGDADNVQKNLARVGQYSKSVSCWFCQREITGEQVHFFAMDSDLTTLVRETKTDGSPLPSTHQSQDLIYACRGCHSAISKKADEIALAYHVVALAKMNEINIHLQRQINELYRMAHRH